MVKMKMTRIKTIWTFSDEYKHNKYYEIILLLICSNKRKAKEVDKPLVESCKFDIFRDSLVFFGLEPGFGSLFVNE